MKHFQLSRSLNADELIRKNDVFSCIWRDIFQIAHDQGTSDIHIETFSDKIRVRVRKNGELIVIKEFADADLLDQLMIRLKEIAGLDISVRDEPQDSAFELNSCASRYRAALCPGIFGETIVLRVIQDHALPNLADCNLSPAAENDLRQALSQEKGFICITGPTGSGKSTTLQACLMEINRLAKKVITLEDPVERKIPDVVQQQISSKLTWAKGIKIAMRQDPDIILVGEIRDPESAALALQAAQTGHLVLSTLHTNDVAGIVDRLIGLGVERQVLAENLLFISAQRLLPTLCMGCRILLADGHASRGPGCSACEGQGLRGRTAILEYAMRPASRSILAFSRADFVASQLRQSLAGEILKLVSLGLVDRDFLDRHLN
jgi:type II secretory ATPase GspE/PulE/Tfp pilus assembly ATPase PilB-like protein